MRPIILAIHDRPVNIVKFNKDGDLFFTGSTDKTIAVFWTDPVECLGTFDAGAAVRTLDVTTDSRYLIVGTNVGTVLVFEALTGVLLKQVDLALGMIPDLQLSHGNHFFFLIHNARKTNESVVSVYELEQFLERKEYTPRVLTKRNIEMYHKGAWGYLNRQVALALERGNVEVVSFDTGEKLMTVKIHEDKISSIGYSPDFSFLITSSRDFKSKLLKADDLTILKTFKAQRPLNTAVISPLMMSREHVKYHALIGGGPDAREVTQREAEEGEFAVSFFNLIYESEVGSVRGHFGPVHSITVHPQGRIFVTGSEDGNVRVHTLDDSYFTSAFN